MNINKDGSDFRWFVIAWMSLAGVYLFVYLTLNLLSFPEYGLKIIVGVLPMILLSLLIYSYIKNKANLFKRLCYVYIGIGLPCILVMFVAPMMLWI